MPGRKRFLDMLRIKQQSENGANCSFTQGRRPSTRHAAKSIPVLLPRQAKSRSQREMRRKNSVSLL